MDAVIIIATLLAGLAVGAAATWFVGRAAQQAASGALQAALAERDAVRAGHDALAAEHRSTLDEHGKLQRAHAAIEATARGLEQQLTSSKAAEAEAMRREREESRVVEQLTPVRESLTRMQTQILELERQRSEQHGQLAAQLRASVASEERLRHTAETLAGALASSSTRGVWGETELRRVVESAGLIERVHFDTQATITADDRRLRPDMVVKLPGDKHLALDAKAPFDAYLEASRIPLTASDAELARRASLLQRHVKALRSHIDTLASKQYWTGVANSPEFVVAFIPSESLVSAALEADPSLMDYAFAKHVALASPVTLWGLLKSVAISWNQAAIAEDAQRVHDLSQELYERVATMAQHTDKLRGAIESSVKHFNAFSASLESRVLVTARKMARLDAPKPIAEARVIDVSPRSITAAEMTEALEAAPEASAADRAIEDLARAEASAADASEPGNEERAAS